MEISFFSVVSHVETHIEPHIESHIETLDHPICPTKPQAQAKNQVAACRYCRHFQPIGTRGGECTLLQSHVGGDWSACNLAESGFETELKSPEHAPSSPLPILSPSMSPSLANILINAIEI